jgi:SAM-dependent methyltransferase
MLMTGAGGEGAPTSKRREFVAGLAWLSFGFVDASKSSAALVSRPSKSEVESCLDGVVWEDETFADSDFRRLDSSPDSLFYAEPRLVEHIDVPAQKAMEAFYRKFLDQVAAKRQKSQQQLDILDCCSSWVSHLPSECTSGRRAERIAGLGMNAVELEANPQLTEWVVRDLNATPSLPYADKSFDAIVLALSIDYLISPVKIMQEASRVLREGGSIAVVISNRVFLSKCVGRWSGSDDIDHIIYVGACMHQAPGLSPAKAYDLSPHPKRGDPLYAIVAAKGSV